MAGLQTKTGTTSRIRKVTASGAIEKYSGELRNRKMLSPEEARLALDMVVHLVGDMHCPSHVHFKEVRDKNDLKYTVIYKGKAIRYHNIWDTDILVDRYIGGPVYFGYYCDPLLNGSIDRREARCMMESIQSGIIYDWAYDAANRITLIFDPAIAPEPDSAVTSYRVFAPTGRDMVLCAGYRLAALLSDIFR